MIDFKDLFRRYERQGFTPLRCKGYHVQHNPKRDYEKAKRPVDSNFTSKNFRGVSLEKALNWINQGGWIGWVIPPGLVVIDVENKTDIVLIKKFCTEKHISPPEHNTNKGKHFFFKYKDDLPGSSSVFLKCGIEVTYRIGRKNYLILPPINERSWEVLLTEEVPELLYEFSPYDPENADDVLNILSCQIRNALLEGYLNGYEGIDQEYMTFLLEHGFSNKHVHKTFETVFGREYDFKRTEYMYKRTRERIANNEPVRGTGSLMQHIIKKGIRKVERFIKETERVVRLSQFSQSYNDGKGMKFNDKLSKLSKLPSNKNESISDEIIFPTSPFPLKIFPKRLRHLIRKAGKALHIEPEIIASTVLAIVSSAIGNTIRVSPKEGYNVPPFLWLIVIALSGYGKTPAFQLLLKPVEQRQARAYQDYKKASQRYKMQMIQIKKSKSQCSIPDKPRAEHFLIEDFTIEALGDIFEDCSRGVVCYISEIAAMISGLNQYKARGNDRQHYLKLFDCDSWKIDRKAHGIKFVPNTGASIIGGIQPKIMPRIFHEEAFDEGLIPRFLLILAERKPLKFSRVAITEEDISYWAELLDWCYKIPVNLDENGFVKPNILKLNNKTLRHWERFHNDYMERMTSLSERAKVFIPKLAGYYSLKIAGILHCIKKFDQGGKINGKIDLQTIKESINIIRYFAGQVMRALKLYDRESSAVKLNDAQTKLIRTLYDLKNEVKQGKLRLLLITDAFNNDMPENVKLSSKQIRNMLIGLGLTVKKSTRNRAFLFWENDKIDSLFSKVPMITSVANEENL
jgi:hypothetical protein